MNPIAKSPLPAAPAQAPAASTGQAATKDKAHDGSFEDLMPGAKNPSPGKNLQPSPGKDGNRLPAKSAPDKAVAQAPKSGAKAASKDPSDAPDPAEDAPSEDPVPCAKTPLETPPIPPPIPPTPLAAPLPTPVPTQATGELGFDVASDAPEPSQPSSEVAWTSVRMSQATPEKGVNPQIPVQALVQVPGQSRPGAASEAPPPAVTPDPASTASHAPTDPTDASVAADFIPNDQFSASNVRWLTAAPASAPADLAPADPAPSDPAPAAAAPAPPAVSAVSTVSTVSMVAMQAPGAELPVDFTPGTPPPLPNISTETSGTGAKTAPPETELATNKSTPESAPDVKEKLPPSSGTPSAAAQPFPIQAKAGAQPGSLETSGAAVQIRANFPANREPGTAAAMHPAAMSDPYAPRPSLPKTAGIADAVLPERAFSVAPQAQNQDPQQKPGDKKSNDRTGSAGEIAEPPLTAPQITAPMTGPMTGPMNGLQKSAAIPATEITTMVHRTLEAAEHVRISGQDRVEVRMRLDSGEELLIELRVSQQGEVKPVFRTESEALRQALEQNWARFSSAGTERGIKLSNPVFESPQTQSGMSDLNQNHDGRERAFAQARDENFTSTLLRGIGAKPPAPTKPKLVSSAESASRYA